MQVLITRPKELSVETRAIREFRESLQAKKHPENVPKSCRLKAGFKHSVLFMVRGLYKTNWRPCGCRDGLYSRVSASLCPPAFEIHEGKHTRANHNAQPALARIMPLRQAPGGYLKELIEKFNKAAISLSPDHPLIITIIRGKCS